MEGARMQKAPGGRKRSWIVLAAVLAVLVGGYLGLCAWVGAQGVLPHVTAGGLDLSGMSEEQAALALEEAAAQAAPGLWVELRYGDWSGTLTGEDVEVDCQRAARAAWAEVDPIRSITDSASSRESFPLRKARLVNSPGWARRAPACRQASSTRPSR